MIQFMIAINTTLLRKKSRNLARSYILDKVL